MAYDNDDWLNTSPVSKNHVKVMDCTYAGWYFTDNIFENIGTQILPIKDWLADHDMLGRTMFDYRAYRDPATMNTHLHWYVVFDNQEDMVLYKLCEQELLSDILEGMFE